MRERTCISFLSLCLLDERQAIIIIINIIIIIIIIIHSKTAKRWEERVRLHGLQDWSATFQLQRLPCYFQRWLLFSGVTSHFWVQLE